MLPRSHGYTTQQKSVAKVRGASWASKALVVDLCSEWEITGPYSTM